MRQPDAAGAAGGDGADVQEGRPGAWRVPWYYGAALLLFGAAAWPVGAWYTLTGWVWVVNWVLAFVHAPWAVPAPAGVVGLIAAAMLGGLYSRVELHAPLRVRGWRIVLLAWLAWLAVILSDVGTTYAGIAQPGLYAALIAIVLTFAPDQAIMRGIRILRGRAPF